MKKLLLSFAFFSISIFSFSQSITHEDEKYLEKKEDSLKRYSIKILQDSAIVDRFKADSIFTKMLVRALKIPHSFFYPFDSLQTVSKLYAPDSSFRIFTWQMVFNENFIRQHGAIQMNTHDGSLKLFPLIDKSDVVENIADTVADNKGWIGAVYYRIIQKKVNNQNYYTLLGYDENNSVITRKIIEVLSFPHGEPVFGGHYFSFEEDSIAKKSSMSRYLMEFKKSAGPRLNYDEGMDMIVMEHLESQTNEPNKKWTLIPDGDYEGFKWKNGKWVHVEKIFNYITPEGQAPLPKPLRETQSLTEDKLANPEEKETSKTKSHSSKPRGTKSAGKK